MPNEPEILLGLIRLAKAGDHDAADQLRRILIADINGGQDAHIADLAGYLVVVKRAEARKVAG